MPSNHLILCHPLLFLLSICPCQYLGTPKNSTTDMGTNTWAPKRQHHWHSKKNKIWASSNDLFEQYYSRISERETARCTTTVSVWIKCRFFCSCILIFKFTMKCILNQFSCNDLNVPHHIGLPSGKDSVVKNPAINAADVGSMTGSGRSPGKGNGNPLQYSCLENSMDRALWWTTVHRVTKSWTGLSD